MCQVDVLSYHCDRSSVYWIKIVLDSFKISNIKQQPWEHTATHTLVINADTIPPPGKYINHVYHVLVLVTTGNECWKKKNGVLTRTIVTRSAALVSPEIFLTFKVQTQRQMGLGFKVLLKGTKTGNIIFSFFFAGRECSPWKKNACWWIHKISHVTFLSNILPTSAK